MKLPGWSTLKTASWNAVRFSPLAALVILIGAWIVSIWLPCFVSVRTPSHLSILTVNLNKGTLLLMYDEMFASLSVRNVYAGSVTSKGRPAPNPHNPWLGKFEYRSIKPLAATNLANTRMGFIYLPIPLLMVLVLPFAVAAVNQFRFRLWHYFAYIALLAAAIAYWFT